MRFNNTLFSVCIFLIVAASCREVNRDGLYIDSLSPQGASVGTVVTIAGRGFAPDIQGNKVSIGTEEIGFSALEVVSATENEIRVRIPELEVDCYQLQVERKDFAPDSEQLCIVEFPLPKVTGISPASGSVGDLITIHGEDLGASAENNRVSFTGEDGSILYLVPPGATNVSIDDAFTPLEFASIDSIQVQVPRGAGTGPIYISVDPTGSGMYEIYYSATTPTFTVIP